MASYLKGKQMNRICLGGIAVLFLTTGAAHAAEKGNTLPPVEFDKPFTGELEIVRIRNFQEVEATCKETSKYACAARLANGARCVVFIMPDKQMRHYGKNAIAFIWRHELGHCNGWPGDHKNGCEVSKEFRDGHIAMPTMPAIVKELPVFPPVVCVTPDWKQEPCAKRLEGAWAHSRSFDVTPHGNAPVKDVCAEGDQEACELLKKRAIQMLKTIPVVPQ
jgi:hypothetical protein